MSDDSTADKRSKASHLHSHEQDQELRQCHCDANLFYNKYKAKLDDILAKHETEKEELVIELKKSVVGKKPDRKKSSDSKRFSHVRKSEERKSDVQKTNVKKSSTTFKKKEKIEKKSIDHISKDSKADVSAYREEDKDQIQLKKKKDSSQLSKGDVAKDGLYKKGDSKSYVTAVRSFTSYKNAEQIGPSTSKEAQSEHVAFYATALEEKLQLIFGEGGGEESIAMTGRGYYIFDRYYEDQSDQSTVHKISSGSSTSREGEDYTYHPAEPAEEEWMSESMRKALEYLKKHKIQELFKYLGAHLVAANPCNPIDFLINLLENCFNYRMGYCEPPLLYQPKHVESLFHSMDPMGTGLIEMNQYHIGMYTLGIKDYNMFPGTIKNNMVQKKTFVNEALNQLRNQLNAMIQNFGTPLTAATMISSAQYFSAHGETEPIEQ